MSRTTLSLTIVAALLLWPALARAQGDSPFSNCKFSTTLKEGADNALLPGTDVHEWRLRGSVTIICDDTKLDADEVHWRDDSDIFYANGNVVFQQQGTRISADRAEINSKTHEATFFDAWGVLQLNGSKADRSLFGGQEPDATFRGEKIEKLADHVYKLTNGNFTTCAQPTPRWEMYASSVMLVPDDHAFLRNMVLKVKDVPVFYVPAFYYPINKEGRSTGFLMPQYGSTTLKGFTLGNAFFWAIDRSQDATFYHEWSSKTGQGYGGEYRYVEGPGSQGSGLVHVIRETPVLDADGTVVTPARQSFTVTGDLTQGFGTHVRLLARSNYASSVQALQTFHQSLYDVSRRTRDVGAQVYGTWGRYRLSSNARFTDTFADEDNGVSSARRDGLLPDINFGIAEKPIRHTPVYFGATTDFSSFVSSTDLSDPTQHLGLRRFDTNPVVRVPLSHWDFLTVTTSASWRFTRWSDSLTDAGRVDEPLSRQIVQLQAGLTGPTFTRIYNTDNSGYAEKFKHVIAPSFNISRITHFEDFSRVVQTDYIDQIVGGVTQINYGLTNQVLAKRRQAGGAPGVVREVLTFDVGQSYYSDKSAGAYDVQYQTSQGSVPLSKFSPVRLVFTGRPSDQISGVLRMEYDHQAHAFRSMTTSGSLDHRVLSLTAGWSKHFVIPGLLGFDAFSAANAMNVAATVRHPEGHLGGTWSWTYDIRGQSMLQQRVTGFYNSQCCGVAAEYQRVALPASYRGVSVDQRFNFSFSLAGLGTFSNPLGSFLTR
jgi:LPS-assembly protein